MNSQLKTRIPALGLRCGCSERTPGWFNCRLLACQSRCRGSFLRDHVPTWPSLDARKNLDADVGRPRPGFALHRAVRREFEMYSLQEEARLARLAIIRKKLFSIHPYCCLCHQRIQRRNLATLDHVIPISRGGTDDVSNLDLCCRKCNRFKGCHTPSEFAAILETVLYNVRLRVEGCAA